MKSAHHFQVKVNVDKETGTILAVYFTIRGGKSAQMREFAAGAAFADYNSRGELLGIELLAPCAVTVLDKIAPKDPQARKFIRSAIPRELALA